MATVFVLPLSSKESIKGFCGIAFQAVSEFQVDVGDKAFTVHLEKIRINRNPNLSGIPVFQTTCKDRVNHGYLGFPVLSLPFPDHKFNSGSS